MVRWCLTIALVGVVAMISATLVAGIMHPAPGLFWGAPASTAASPEICSVPASGPTLGPPGLDMPPVVAPSLPAGSGST